MADKKKRVKNLIARNLSDIIIYDLKSELCQLASVNEVRVTNDYSHAKVYVTHLDRERIEPLLKFLNSRKGQIRSMLSSKMDIYKIPELHFVQDELYDQGAKIDSILNKINNSNNSK